LLGAPAIEPSKLPRSFCVKEYVPGLAFKVSTKPINDRNCHSFSSVVGQPGKGVFAYAGGGEYVVVGNPSPFLAAFGCY
jgi:hypothetical protein